MLHQNKVNQSLFPIQLIMGVPNFFRCSFKTRSRRVSNVPLIQLCLFRLMTLPHWFQCPILSNIFTVGFVQRIDITGHSFPFALLGITRLTESLLLGITRSTSPDVAKSRHITAKYFNQRESLALWWMRLSARGLRLGWQSTFCGYPPAWCATFARPGRHPAPQLYAVCSPGGTSLTLASGWYRPFYKTEKSITGRGLITQSIRAAATAGVLLCFGRN